MPPLRQVENLLASGNAWATVVPNKKEDTLASLTPTAATGNLAVKVGRVHVLSCGRRCVEEVGLYSLQACGLGLDVVAAMI